MLLFGMICWVACRPWRWQPLRRNTERWRRSPLQTAAAGQGPTFSRHVGCLPLAARTGKSMRGGAFDQRRGRGFDQAQHQALSAALLMIMQPGIFQRTADVVRPAPGFQHASRFVKGQSDGVGLHCRRSPPVAASRRQCRHQAFASKLPCGAAALRIQHPQRCGWRGVRPSTHRPRRAPARRRCLSPPRCRRHSRPADSGVRTPPRGPGLRRRLARCAVRGSGRCAVASGSSRPVAAPGRRCRAARPACDATPATAAWRAAWPGCGGRGRPDRPRQPWPNGLPSSSNPAGGTRPWRAQSQPISIPTRSASVLVSLDGLASSAAVSPAILQRFRPCSSVGRAAHS